MTNRVRTISMAALAGRTGRGLRIAVIDSGVHAGHPHIGPVEASIAFDDRGAEHPDFVDRLGHGTAVAAAIHEKAPEAAIIAVKIFDREMVTTCAALAAAIQWAAEARADIINLSLGTANAEHRDVLESVVAEAVGGRALVIAAAPAKGQILLPGALPGVIGVEVDWTCPREECLVEQRDDGRVLVRASGYPRPIPGVSPERNLKGQSFAVGNATGLIALTIEGTNHIGRAAKI